MISLKNEVSKQDNDELKIALMNISNFDTSKNFEAETGLCLSELENITPIDRTVSSLFCVISEYFNDEDMKELLNADQEQSASYERKIRLFTEYYDVYMVGNEFYVNFD
ncbi:hypothetical protein HOS50_gp002 [Lactobacillus phage Lenus]|uniref:Uncharacterized protein n=1 Tax=Lactobacillus phage Lenus TaxID=2053682 RepID=A0A2H4PBE8_9CAUD|nr:hypothetical protein HOS50_gp002 [Lactobacillus phage Lenus]ATW59419.1 hypothetical protein [Lactobacillus phage Lenus]